MQLNQHDLNQREKWEKAGFELPQFDREEMCLETKKNPFWIHFGAGNIFRAFQANAVQNLLNSGVIKAGLVVAEGFDYEIIDKVYKPYDNLSILVTMHEDGTLEKKVVGSIAEAIVMDRKKDKEFKRLQEIFQNESLQIASFTITEKGYCLTDKDGNFVRDICRDFEMGPFLTESYMGKIASLLYHRFQNGQLPLAMVSMDNCSQNGKRLYEGILTFGKEWVKNGLAEEEFISYIDNETKVSFPYTMIDKITPRPDSTVEMLLNKAGVENIGSLITQKGTFTAPYVNAEECEYLVIEDSFPNERPALEGGGFLFTNRKTVEQTEKMKVCTCLNPLHTTLAIFGCLLEYKFMWETIRDPELKFLVEEIGYKEGLPVVEDPAILNPKQFLQTVLTKRIPNPYMPDSPQRIVTDTSQKLPIRFGETIKAYHSKDKNCKDSLSGISLVFAGWLRYLMGTNDRGEKMELSMDPLLEMLKKRMSLIQCGQKEEVEKILRPLLMDKTIFGVDLYEVKMAEEVINYFCKMNDGAGSVRNMLKEYKENKEN